MKKHLSLLSAAVLVLTLLAGCGQTAAPAPAQSGDSTPAQSGESAPASSEKPLNYPVKNVDFIIPYAAGGGTDGLMRLLAADMEQSLGKPIVPANKAGNLGQLGLTELSKKPADGYTLGALSNLDHILVLLTGQNLEYGYDDFAYIGAINTTANVLIASAQSGFQSLDELTAYAKENPGKITAAISGKTHVAELGLLQSAAGVKITPVMHSGGGESLNALLGGHVDVAVLDKKFVDQIAGKNCPTLASFSGERVSTIPDVPTMKELGYDVSTETYRVVVAPKGTPPEIVALLSETMKQVSATPEFQEKMAGMSEVYRFLSPEEVKARLDEDLASMQKLIADNPEIFAE